MNRIEYNKGSKIIATLVLLVIIIILCTHFSKAETIQTRLTIKPDVVILNDGECAHGYCVDVINNTIWLRGIE